MAWPADSWETKLTCVTQTPADGTSVAASHQTMSVHWHDTNAADALAAYGIGVDAGIKQVVIQWRINSAAYATKSTVYSTLQTEATVNKQLTGLRPGDSVSWYSYAIGNIGEPATYTYATMTASRSFTVAADSSGPTFSSRYPADATTGTPPKTFTAVVADAYGVASVSLWVDGAQVNSVTGLDDTSYSYSYTVLTLSVGAHSWYLVATDINGNESTSPTWAWTAENVAPTMPGVPYYSGLAGVGGELRVRWTPGIDYNGDAITYDLAVDYNGGGWAMVGTGISATEYYWTPATAGSTQLRVRAYDGTDYSSWRTSDYFTVYANNPPGEPTIVEPSGGESLTEGDTFTITWTEHAAPIDPEGNAVTYEGEFSELGTFADAVAIFEGVAQGTTLYDWTLTADLVTADRAVSKVRIRARDSFNGVSAWSTSAAFTVIENTAPVVAWVGLSDGDTLTTNLPALTLLLTDADSDACHVEIEFAETADFSGGQNPDSRESQIGWEEASSPFTAWTAVPTTGATAANRVRYTVQAALRYDYYYLRARAFDGHLYGEWTTTIRVLIAYSGAEPLFATIDGVVWWLEECSITECTGGEPSPMALTIPTLLMEAAANPPTRGDSVSVACNIEGTARVWNGTLEEIVYDGPYVRLACIQDDAYLSRKLATGDATSADVGANLAAFVTSYGSPLTGTGIDGSTGLTAALTGGYKSLREHFGDWSDTLRYHLYVDATGDISWKAEADLGVPEYVLREG